MNLHNFDITNSLEYEIDIDNYISVIHGWFVFVTFPLLSVVENSNIFGS